MAVVKNNQAQRVLALGLLVVVIFLLAALIITPIVSKGLALRETKESLVFKLQKYERILAKKDTVLKSMAKIRAQHLEQDYFNKEKTPSLASAGLQELVKKAVVDSGGQLSSTQALPETEKDKFTLITVSVRMTGTMETLRSVLYKLETATPLIVIDQMDLRPMRGKRNRLTRKLEPSNDLNVNFQAVSFMRKQPT
ncbi:type II secretion system protein GspM [Crenothrix polyspora]|jgi:general secretion pathway protein M|uniref:General secretion pathway protein M n=1 Tax=Crenothrix polyspora TaxID=360316 RepID=A0A1R4HHS7_9GAMM|nr:type II secretion system protein GspM [Crenothrix polyspora]SJM95759.1 General secretion pathway protein M [Crenothrix polyspora]